MMPYDNPVDTLRECVILWRYLGSHPWVIDKQLAADDLGLLSLSDTTSLCPCCEYDDGVSYAKRNTSPCSHCLVWVDPAITGACTNRHTNPDSGQLPGAFSRWEAKLSLRAIEAKIIADEAEENLNLLLSIGYKGSSDEA